MANNFTLSPEDRLLWQQRAPRASYWFRVSDTHPFINGGQPIPGLGATPPPPPYTPAQMPAPPIPAMQPYFGNGQVIPGIPAPMMPFPSANTVPIYDVRHQNVAPAIPEDPRPSLPPRFTVSVPLKQSRRQDTPSRAEIALEWDILFGDFYDRISARMDLDPKDAVLGYKFEGDPKRSIIRLPSNDLVAFDTMLEKVKSRIARARTRAVVLEIHDLATKKPVVAAKKKPAATTTQSPLTTEQTKKLKLLEEKLRCAEHQPWCWVASDGTHKAITVFQITLWAQMIADGMATIEQPPAVKAFDYLPKRVQKEKTTPVPQIHVHFPAHINVGASSSTQVGGPPEVVSDVDQEIVEPPASVFKSEADHSSWNF